eukprot:GEMP01029612.1.p1 GENE.GEMP01029612.1~~GEMP01029612.1.p1  ORF type:complete len:706 (-),score=158.07 GEMP01029612.1:38-2155(-)
MALAASVEVDNFFRTQQLPKIEEILEATKRDVEQKKEELREKVGNHYREVLASSDSIHNMHQCVQSIHDSQSILQDLRGKLKRKLVSFHEEPPRTATTQYRWAKKVKELVDLPSRIQQAVGSHSFLQAATLLLQEGPSLVTTLDAMPEALKKVFRWDHILRDHRAKLETLMHVLHASCLTAFDEPISLQAARESISMALTFESEAVDYLSICFGKWHDGMDRSSLATARAIVNFESVLLAAQCFNRGQLQSCLDALQAFDSVEPLSAAKLQRVQTWSENVADAVRHFVQCWSSTPSSSFPKRNVSPKELHEFCEKTSEVVWDFRLKKGWSAEAWAAVSNLPDSLQTLRRQAEVVMITNIQQRVSQCEKPLEVATLEKHIDVILKELDETYQRHVLIEAVFQATSTLVIQAVKELDNAQDNPVSPENQALMLYALYQSFVSGQLYSMLKAGKADSDFSYTPVAQAVLGVICTSFQRWTDALPPFARQISPEDVRIEDASSAFMWGTLEQQGRSLTVPVSCSSDVLHYLLRIGLTLNALTTAPMAVDAAKRKLATTLECLGEPSAHGLQVLFDVHFLLLLLGDDFSATVEKVEARVLADPVDKLIYANLVKRLAREHLSHGHIIFSPFFPNGVPPAPASPVPTVHSIADPLRPLVTRFQMLPVAAKEVRQPPPPSAPAPSGPAGTWAAGMANMAGMTGIPDVKLWKK